MALNLTLPPEFNYSSRSDAEVRWPIWKRRIEIFLKASGIDDDERKWAIMLNQAGTQDQEVFERNFKATRRQSNSWTILRPQKEQGIMYTRTRHESVRREILDSDDSDSTEDILRRVREAELVENLVKVTLKAEVLNKEPTEAKKSDDEKQVDDKKETSNGELFCHRCGGEFPYSQKLCPAWLTNCNMCGKRGHYTQRRYGS